MLQHVLSRRARTVIKFDLLRLRARLLHHRRQYAPAAPRLHFGCGSRRIPGWLNVDVMGSEFDVDLACGRLPWPSDSFEAMVGQQVVEHLELTTELLPLLKELARVARRGAELWLACPDLEKVCRSYLECRGKDLIEDRRARFTDFSIGDIPSQHMINVYFHQGNEHRNLFDLELLAWALESAGFANCERMSEADLLRRFPEFPPRNDDYHALYVRAFARGTVNERENRKRRAAGESTGEFDVLSRG